MNSKGITFNLCSEEGAADYLARANNYLRTASYRKLFPRQVDGLHVGEYVNLDFEHLRALSRIDRCLREALLLATADVEHFAKIKARTGSLGPQPTSAGWSSSPPRRGWRLRRPLSRRTSGLPRRQRPRANIGRKRHGRGVPIRVAAPSEPGTSALQKASAHPLAHEKGSCDRGQEEHRRDPDEDPFESMVEGARDGKLGIVEVPLQIRASQCGHACERQRDHRACGDEDAAQDLPFQLLLARELEVDDLELLGDRPQVVRFRLRNGLPRYNDGAGCFCCAPFGPYPFFSFVRGFRLQKTTFMTMTMRTNAVDATQKPMLRPSHSVVPKTAIQMCVQLLFYLLCSSFESFYSSSPYLFT